MKKIMRLIVVVLVVVVSTVMPVMAATDVDLSHLESDCYVTMYTEKDYYIIEKTQLSDFTPETDFYSAFMWYIEDAEKPINNKIYVDSSSSMSKTFSYETSKVMENLQPYLDKNGLEYEKVLSGKGTDLNTMINNYVLESNQERDVDLFPLDTLMMVTDLWNTEAVEFNFKNKTANMVFFVPYKSTNVEAVTHCEQVVNDILWGQEMCFSTIDIVYMDDVVVEYCKLFVDSNDGTIEIFVP